MFALFKKEFSYFFSSPIGIVLIGLFSLMSNLFLWFLQSGYNIIDSGFADLHPFFLLSSWIFIFLIPAITMRMISEEKRNGTLQLLLSAPVSIQQIILAKYIAVLCFIAIILAPSLFNIYLIKHLLISGNHIDYSVILGSYIALFLLCLSLTAIGIFASCLNANQIIAFTIATFLNFFLFYAIDELFYIIVGHHRWSLGLLSHFEDISRGIIDTRNVMYFFLISIFFLYLSIGLIKSEKL